MAQLLTVVTKIGGVILTIWYALKVKIKPLPSWLLGFSTLLPLMVWVSLLILLTKEVRKIELINKADSDSEILAKEKAWQEQRRKKLERLEKEKWPTIIFVIILGAILIIVAFLRG